MKSVTGCEAVHSVDMGTHVLSVWNYIVEEDRHCIRGDLRYILSEPLHAGATGTLKQHQTTHRTETMSCNVMRMHMQQ